MLLRYLNNKVPANSNVFMNFCGMRCHLFKKITGGNYLIELKLQKYMIFGNATITITLVPTETKCITRCTNVVLQKFQTRMEIGNVAFAITLIVCNLKFLLICKVVAPN